MKSRLLRALGVGAALLIPVSGLALLSGVDPSPAGALMSSTPPTLCFMYAGGVPASHVKLIDTVKLGGNGNTSGAAGCVGMTETGTSTTYKSNQAYSYTTSTLGFTILIPVTGITATYNASGIANVKLSVTGHHATAKLGTTGTFAHCEVTTIPSVTFSDTRGQLPLKNTGVSLAGAMVGSYTGTCSTSAKSTINTKLTHTDISGVLYVL